MGKFCSREYSVGINGFPFSNTFVKILWPCASDMIAFVIAACAGVGTKVPSVVVP